MNRIAALLEKEARHHLAVAVGLVLWLPMSYLLVAAGHALSPSNISSLLIHVTMLWFFIPLTALVLGNRLIVTEYQRSTQLFLEALPIRRSEMVSVKWVLGFVALETIAVLSLLLTVLIASSTEVIDPRFFGIMAARTVVYVACLWGLFFAMGFLGRFRVPLYIAMVVGLFAIDVLTDFEIGRFGPLALIDEQLALDRERVPWSELEVTGALAFGFSAFGFILALLDEGSVVESLSRRMTLKEKSVAGALIVGLLIAVTALDERREREPFAFQSDALIRAAGGGLEVLYVNEEAQPDAEALAEALEADLVEIQRILGRSKLPMVRVALRESLDARTFEPAKLPQRDGILVRVNFRGWSGDEIAEQRVLRSSHSFRAFVIKRILLDATDERAGYEPRAWVLDGFARWFVERDRSEACWTTPMACPPLLRALWAFEEPAALDLDRWFRMRERHGEEVSEALAYSAILSIEREGGRAAVEAVARAFWGRRPPLDLREVIRERRQPASLELQQAVGRPFEVIVAGWRDEMTARRGAVDVEEALAAVGDPRATFDLTLVDGTLPRVSARVRLARPLAEPAVITLLHREIGPFDRSLELHELQREERVLDAGARELEIELLGRYGRGVRVFLAVDVESRALGCPIRLLARRGVLE